MGICRKKHSALFLCFLLLLFSSGCAVVVGTVIGGGATAYFKGVLKTEEPVSFDNLWLAVVEVVEQDEFRIVEKQSDMGKAYVEAKFLGKKSVHITVNYHKSEITKLSIRVGVLGDEEESRRILKMIHEKLY